MNPTFTRDQAQAFLDQQGITDKVVFLAYRSVASAYGEYDDTFGLLTPLDYTEFKANTLPSRWEGDIAKLLPGVYTYKKGLHGLHHLNLTTHADGSYVCPGDKQILDTLNSQVGKDHDPIPGRILPYWAFRQAGPVYLQRHDKTVAEWDGWPADPAWIDLHSGGWNGTSSAGCQTFFPDRWKTARLLGYEAMDSWHQQEIKYCLVQL